VTAERTADRTPLLGCIADDLTGAIDLSGSLVREGMRVIQLIGIPSQGQELPPADAIVVAQKTRSIPVAEAVGQSVRSLRWLLSAGCRSIYFKYCSTFDSTAEGNIGPVTDALLDEFREEFTVLSPAFPRTGRTIYLGHLFVGTDLLADSGMRFHPLTPMTDSSLLRLMARQSRGKVGLVGYPVVSRGSDAIGDELGRLRSAGYRYAVVDALDDTHLAHLAEATAGWRLLTGGSALAAAAAAVARERGAFTPAARWAAAPPGQRLPESGRAAVLAGSCSSATLAQVADMKSRYPAFKIDEAALARGEDVADAAIRWALPLLPSGPVLVFSSTDPEGTARATQLLGPDAGEQIEQTLGKVARGLVAAGVSRLVVAGGETSGAVTGALGIRSLHVGGEIEPGVPVTVSADDPPLALVLKSGNFGSTSFLEKALRSLESLT